MAKVDLIASIYWQQTIAMPSVDIYLTASTAKAGQWNVDQQAFQILKLISDTSFLVISTPHQ